MVFKILERTFGILLVAGVFCLLYLSIHLMIMFVLWQYIEINWYILRIFLGTGLVLGLLPPYFDEYDKFSFYEK